MIIFNLDGTLADCEHRRHFVDPDKNIHILKGVDDEVFSRAFNFLSQVLRSFVAVHMDSHAFTEPNLVMTTDGVFKIEIGIRKKT